MTVCCDFIYSPLWQFVVTLVCWNKVFKQIFRFYFAQRTVSGVRSSARCDTGFCSTYGERCSVVSTLWHWLLLNVRWAVFGRQHAVTLAFAQRTLSGVRSSAHCDTGFRSTYGERCSVVSTLWHWLLLNVRWAVFGRQHTVTLAFVQYLYDGKNFFSKKNLISSCFNFLINVLLIKIFAKPACTFWYWIW